jgi:hypothetical protein
MIVLFAWPGMHKKTYLWRHNCIKYCVVLALNTRTTCSEFKGGRMANAGDTTPEKRDPVEHTIP